MSLIFAPEPVAVVTPPVVVRPVAPRPDTRPIEPSDQANAGSSEHKQNAATGNPAPKAEPSPRPPGTDPSVPPQTLIDASLISEGFKPKTRPDAAEAAEPVAAGAFGDETDGDAEAGASETAAPAQDTGLKVEARQIAAYGRASGASPLSSPSNYDPNWLSAIEKIA